MELTDRDIKYLSRTFIRNEKDVLEENWVPRCMARQEAARLLLNLVGYDIDHDGLGAFKRTQKEKREYINATTTD